MWVSLYKDRRRKPGAQGPMHGSSACIAPDGKVLFATAEGHLSKHDSRFPLMAIEGKYVLRGPPQAKAILEKAYFDAHSRDSLVRSGTGICCEETRLTVPAGVAVRRE
jgi:hypothetical protein